jgi:hypothetical protein
MHSKTIHAIATVAVLLVLGGGGWYVYANTIGRPMLEGEQQHDFGVVWLEGPETSVSHTFRLVNNTGELIFINDIKSTCKCAVPGAAARRLMPGDTLELPAEVTLRKSGMQKAEINLLLGDGRRQILYVTAIGRRKMPLTYIGRHIELLYSLPKVLGVHCEIHNAEDEPPSLIVRASNAPGVTTSFRRWKPVEFYDAKWQNPAIWEAELIVTRTTPDELPREATIDVSIDGENWLSVPINRPDLIEVITIEDTPGEAGQAGG